MGIASVLGDLVNVCAGQVIMPSFIFGIDGAEKLEQTGIDRVIGYGRRGKDPKAIHTQHERSRPKSHEPIAGVEPPTASFAAHS